MATVAVLILQVVLIHEHVITIQLQDVMMDHVTLPVKVVQIQEHVITILPQRQTMDHVHIQDVMIL